MKKQQYMSTHGLTLRKVSHRTEQKPGQTISARRNI